MGYYNLGLVATLPAPSKPSLYQQGIVVGLIPGYASMGETLRVMNLLDGEIKAASSEMFLAKVSSPSTREADPEFAAFYLGPWSDFVARWSKFREGNSGKWARFVDTNDIYNRTQQFRKEYIGFREKAEEMGYNWQSPEPMAPESEKHGLLREGKDATKDLGAGIEKILWAVAKFTLIGGALFLAFMFISQFIKGG